MSVVIPVWNDSAFLETCLSALARQSRPADEIVVVDNNSTDDSATVARRHGVRVVEQPVQGIAPASAAGFDAASGDLIARLDADSIPPVDWLERIESLALAAGPLTVITGPGDFYGSGTIARWAGRNLYLGGFFRLFRLILGHYPIFGSNFMMSRELWLRVRDNVHRTHGAIHDDIDLSYQLEPDMQVQLEPSLVVGISGRPLSSFAAFYRRAFWVRTTLRLDFRDLSPIRRRLLRRAWSERTSSVSAFVSAAPRTGRRAIR
ncbi:C50 carotenoid glucosyltransferase CrtX [soil metagenome]